MPPKCNQCDSAYIQHVYCHELGCPNTRKYWDIEEEVWKDIEEVEEFDDYDEDYQSSPEDFEEDEILTPSQTWIEEHLSELIHIQETTLKNIAALALAELCLEFSDLFGLNLIEELKKNEN